MTVGSSSSLLLQHAAVGRLLLAVGPHLLSVAGVRRLVLFVMVVGCRFLPERKKTQHGERFKNGRIEISKQNEKLTSSFSFPAIAIALDQHHLAKTQMSLGCREQTGRTESVCHRRRQEKRPLSKEVCLCFCISESITEIMTKFSVYEFGFFGNQSRASYEERVEIYADLKI